MRTNTGQNFKETKLNRLNFQCYYVVVGLAILAAVSLLAGTTISARAADTSTTSTPSTPTRISPHYPPSPVLTSTIPLRKGVKTPRVTPGQPGSVDPSFKSGSGLNGRSGEAIAVQNDGKILVGGDSTIFNNTAIGGIARLNPDGSLDTSFNPGGAGTDGFVKTIALQSDGKILVGGGFTKFNGISANTIARLNPDGSLDTTFNPDIRANNYFVGIETIKIQNDGKILVAGYVSKQENGAVVQPVVRLNSDGSRDNSFNLNLATLPNDLSTFMDVYELELHNGKILLGGYFRVQFNNQFFQYFVQVNNDGSLDTTFVSNTQGIPYPVNAMTVQNDGKVLLAYGTYVYHSTINYLVRFNNDGTKDTSFQTSVVTYNISASALSVQIDGKILVGVVNSFGPRVDKYLLRLNQDGSIDPTFNPGGAGPNSEVDTIVRQSDGKILIGGEFNTYNQVGVNHLARLNPDGTPDTTFNSGDTGADDAVTDIALQNDGKIIIRGNFTAYNGAAVKGIARLNSDGTLDNSFNHVGSDIDKGSIVTLAIQRDDKILIGGSFTSYKGIAVPHIARLNPDGSLDTSFNPAGVNTNDTLFQILLQNDGKILIESGILASYGCNCDTVLHIARLNPDGSLDPSFNPGSGFNSTVKMTLEVDGKILISGNFTSYNDSPIHSIARLNPDGSLDPSFNPGSGVPTQPYYQYISNVTTQNDGKILITGYFDSYNGNPAHSIARLNPDGSLDNSFNAGSGPSGDNNDPNQIRPFITSMIVQGDGKILISGSFKSYNGVDVNSIALLNPDGTLDPSFNSGAGVGGAGLLLNSYAYRYAVILATAVQNDGKILIGGSFSSVDTYTRNNIARLFAKPKSPSTLALISSANPAIAGAPVTFTASVQPITATGTVQFTFFRGNNTTSVSAPIVNGAATYVTSTAQAGTFAVVASYAGDANVSPSVSSLYTQVINPGPPAKVITVGGANQQTTINRVFSQPLAARVTDAFDNPINGLVVTFTTPPTGPSLSFAGSGASYVGTTGPTGVVTTTSLTANATTGVYTVTASVAGVNSVANFTLINMAVCDSFVVTSQLDDGSCGTLRSALLVASNSQTSKTKTITLPFPAGTTLNLAFGLHLANRVELVSSASCGVGPNNSLLPPVILQGGSGDGLTLAGNNRLSGLWVRGFSGMQLKAPAGSHTVMQCVRVSKN